MVDVLLGEERLEDRVAEAEAQDVLDGLFPEVVIDAVDLALVEDARDDRTQLARAREVGPERLLDDDARPRRLALAVDEARGREIADDSGKELGRDRQIEQATAAETELGVEVVEPLLQLQKRLAVVVVPGLIVQGAHEGVVGRDRGAARPRAACARTVAGAALQLLAHRLAVLLVGHRRAREADHGVVVGKVAGRLQLIEGRNELALGEVPGGAEDHQRERVPDP